MSGGAKYFIVEAEAMPEIIRKVAEAKRLLETGEKTTVNGAAREVGISRSAFYKYKDAIYLYDERMNENLVTFYLTLEDRPGVLSSLLSSFYKAGANIITVNQNIPVDGVAIATVSVRTNQSSLSRSEMIEMLGALDGIVEAKTI